MTRLRKPIGRPRRYSEYEDILREHPPRSMNKRPVYVKNIGIYRGKTGDKVFLKIHLRQTGRSIEISKGQLSSWNWQALEAERDRLQGRADRNEPLEDAQSITFEAYAKSWLEIAKTRQRSYQTSMYIVKSQLLPYFAQKQLDEISVKDVNLWQAKRLGEVKPATVQRDKITLKSILNAAIKEELLEKNPCDNANPIKGIEARLRYWTGEELLTVLNAAEKKRPRIQGLYALGATFSHEKRGNPEYEMV